MGYQVQAVRAYVLQVCRITITDTIPLISAILASASPCCSAAGAYCTINYNPNMHDVSSDIMVRTNMQCSNAPH